MSKKEGTEKKHNGGFITVIVLLAVILAALIAVATLATLGYFGGSSEDESSEVEKDDSLTSSSEEVEDEEKDESHTHSYESSYTAPTCTQDGSITLTCLECGDTYTEKIDKLGHDWDNASYGHDEVEHWLVCARCGAQGEKEVHTISTTTTDPTCEGAGLKTDICTICGYHESAAINALGHSWDNGVVTKEATCKEAGEKTYTCTTCNATYTEVISATGTHTFDDGTITKMPTCLEDGEVTFTCTVCNDSYTVVISSTSLGHDYSVIVCDEGYGVHHTICSRCGQVEEDSLTLCTYAGNKYTYDDDGKLHNVCDVCGGLSVNTVETPTANSDGTYDYIASSSSSLSSALGALSSASATDGAQSTITLTEDLDLTGETDNAAYEFGASNVIIDGGEDGATLDVGNQSKVSGDNVTFTNVTFDGSDVDGTARNAAVNVTGKDATFENCTIVGGESASSGLNTAGILVTSSEEGSTITISNCTITGADRAIYIYNAASDTNLYVSDSYLEAVYAFNNTGSSCTGSLTFVNTSLMGWTSYAATTGDVTFTGCTLGFGDNNAHQCYGLFQGYSNATFTDCLFRSFVSRQEETENNLTNIYRAYVCFGHDNYMFGLETGNIVYTLLDCQFEHVCDDEGCTDYEVEALTEENAGYLMSTDYASHTECGFKFSTCEYAKVYTYSDYSTLFNTNTGD